MEKQVNLKNKNHLDASNLPEEIVPKSKFNNIRGQQFSYLTALYPCGYLTKEKRLAWCCICKCGQYVQVTAKNLSNGNTKSCGCLHKIRAIESNHERGKMIQPGDRFGKLTVLNSLGYFQKGDDGKRNEKFLCKCDCGNTKEVWKVYLNSGDTNSCGCIRSVGEQKIMSFLQKYNIPFEKEVTYKDLRSENNVCLRFDFRIKDFLIEYQGDIHYISRETGWNNSEKLDNIQKRDELKEEYCKKNNIKLYKINYEDQCEEKLKEILSLEEIRI